MRFGRLTCKEVAASLGVTASKATQAAEPAILKVAVLLEDYPLETDEALCEARRHVRAMREHKRRLEAAGQTMGDRELSLRECMADGRADRLTLIRRD